MVKIIKPKVFEDFRGKLTKFDCPFEVGESFYSTNKAGVFRGMHYQKDTAKFVYASKGNILDVWLNLKTGEWGKVYLHNKGIVIPKGYAHGFYSLTDSVVHYQQSKAYNPQEEGGIKWDSFGFILPVSPMLSERDKTHPTYEDFRRNSGL